MISALQIQFENFPNEVKGLSISETLGIMTLNFPGKVSFSTSLSMEDQVITHLIYSGLHEVDVFTLDTGRLFEETYSVWSSTNTRYQTKIQAFYPNEYHIGRYLGEKGPNAFYESVDNRKECCHIRKVEPLKRALQGKAVWITGLRSAHSPERKDMQILEWDNIHKIIKYNPLLNWSAEEVSEYIQKNEIPYNSLQDRGYVSIGCAPCTRAILPGEDFRAGRWWWENNEKKECGLHLH